MQKIALWIVKKLHSRFSRFNHRFLLDKNIIFQIIYQLISKTLSI
nr:MAG TPA: hypothetical protein [Caudoviricetes sp.]